MMNRLRKLLGISLKAEIVIPICAFCGESLTKGHSCLKSRILIEDFKFWLDRLASNKS